MFGMSERLRFKLLTLLGLVALIAAIWCIAAWRVGGFESMADLFGGSAKEILGSAVETFGVLRILGFLGFAYFVWLGSDVLWRTREDLKHREQERKNDKP